MRTWGSARTAAIARLRDGVDPATAALDADLLLAFAIGTTKEDVLAHGERALDDEPASLYAALIERRAAGEPVAYLRGWKEFYGLRLRVDARVLIPRPETETLVDEARRAVKGRALMAVDVGTGSGAIACALAKTEPSVHVIATDMSRDALAVAEANVRQHGLGDRVELRQGDLLSPVREVVAIVCANLPYLRVDALVALTGDRTSLAFEPRAAVAGGADGLSVIRRALADLPRVLAPGGVALFECDPAQSAPIAALMRAAGLDADVVRDLAGAERVVRGYRPR